MSKKLTYIIVALILTNCITLGFLFLDDNSGEQITKDKEVVATIGDKEITRQQWLSTLESAYGYDTLKNLIDSEVIYTLADEYDITVTDEEVQRQIEIQQSLYDSYDSQVHSDEQLKNSIYLDLLFKELIIRDAVVEEDELKQYYEEYSSLYKIPNTYHVSQIVTTTQEHANQLLEELKSGSAFDVLAMESSEDEFSAAYGGDVGVITENSGLPTSVFTALDQLGENDWTNPIEVNGQYYIFLLHDKNQGKQYAYEDVKKDIRRDIALSQIGQNFTVDTLWEEAGVEWFYGE